MSLIQTFQWAAVQCNLAGWTQEVLVGKTADMVSISNWQSIFLCANVWFHDRIVTMMRPGHKYLSVCWPLSVKMCSSLHISSTSTQCLLPSLLRDVLSWMTSRTDLKHFAFCLGCHMLYIWTIQNPWKTRSALFKEWCLTWERTNSH